MSRNSSKTTTNHEEIRRWAEARGAHPACVRGTGGKRDTGMIRLDFPGYSGSSRLEEISWDEWFKAFDENNLALVYQDETAEGEQSNFNKLVGRETAHARAEGDSGASRRHPERSRSSRRRRSSRVASSKGSSSGRNSRKTGSKSRSKGTSRRSKSSGRKGASSSRSTRTGSRTSRSRS